jgi:putative membrane protein
MAQRAFRRRLLRKAVRKDARTKKEETTMMGGGLILTLLVLGLVVWAIIKFFPDWQDRLGLNNRREDSSRDDSAEETLRQRFARGEIDAEEYERSLEVLRNGRVSEDGRVPEKSSAKEV